MQGLELRFYRGGAKDQSVPFSDGYYARWRRSPIGEQQFPDSTFDGVTDAKLLAGLRLFERKIESWRCYVSALRVSWWIGEQVGLARPRAERLYDFVRANSIIDFATEQSGRRTFFYFNSHGLLAFYALVYALQRGEFLRPELVEKTRGLLGSSPIASELHDPVQRQEKVVARHPSDRSESRHRRLDSKLVKPSTPQQIATLPVLESIDDQTISREETIAQSKEAVAKRSFLSNMLEFLQDQEKSLAVWTPQRLIMLEAPIRGTDLDTITFPPDLFPVAKAVMFIDAVIEAYERKSYRPLEEFDPSLESLTVREWKYALRVVKNLFIKFPQYRNVGHLLRGNVQWVKERAGEHIGEMKEGMIG